MRPCSHGLAPAHVAPPPFAALAEALYVPLPVFLQREHACSAPRAQQAPPYSAWIGCPSLKFHADWLVSLPLPFQPSGARRGDRPLERERRRQRRRKWPASSVPADTMLPLSLLKTAQNHPMLVELKNGETYNGHLVSCDNWMNINLREVICTSRVSALCPRVCAHHLEALRWGWSGRQRAWGQRGQGCTWTRGLLSLSILAHKWGEGLSLALVGGIDGVPPSAQHSWPARGGACGRCGAPCALDFAPVRAPPRWVLSWPAGLSCCVSVGRPPGYKSLLWAHPFLPPASSAFSPGCGQAIVVWPWAVQATRGRGQPSGPGLLFTS
uniref:Sm domain-containing protein n=1 Tax=Equus asinus asinus TaxID=83772 RepID=A0A8C4PJ21_EQUAS